VDTLSNDDFDTAMHTDLLRLRYGITDDLEIYGDAGVAYHELDGARFVYGGGMRFQFLNRRLGEERSLYGAVQGDFLAGEVAYEYTSNDGNRWDKTADWRDFSGQLELGTRFSRWTLYGGVIYGIYREEARRRLLTNVPAGLNTLTYKDELEEDTPFGGFGGAAFRISPRWNARVEGQGGYRTRLSGQLQYDF
jgi:hypothetical protein